MPAKNSGESRETGHETGKEMPPMALVINHNLMALNTARNLSNHYGAMSTSTQRLSSGLRINSSADDAAGLAVRELMRSDIATMNQGIRNANDAISMIQTADGALQVIDEKLIRMKELAEQAATGTYTDDQRSIINSEYQSMALEIERISNATDFNGIYLLNGNLSGSFNGSGINSTGKAKIHFGTGNDSAEDYYYVSIDSTKLTSLFSNANLVGDVTANAINLYDGNSESTQVNSYTNGNQLYASITSLANGNMLATWQSENQNKSGWSVYGQILDSNGDKVGGEFQVNTYNLSDQTEPKTTTLENGNALVTWASQGQDGSGLGVYGQIIDQNGSKIGSEFKLNSTTLHDQQTSISNDGNPLVSLDNNKFAAVWSSDQQGGSGSNITLRLFNNDGTASTNEIVVSDYANASNIIPSATKLTNGHILVTFSSGGGGLDPSDYGIYGQEFDENGNKIGNNFLVNTYTTDTQNWSTVQSLSDGKYVAAWSSYKQEDSSTWGVYAKIYNQDGSVYKDEFKVNTFSSNDQHMPAIADLGNGAFVVTYNSRGFDGRSGWTTAAQAIDYSGKFLGKEFMVNTETNGDQSNPSITVLNNGNFAIAYNNDNSSGDSSGYGISMRVFNPFLDIRTQNRAQEQLDQISSAMVKKDKIRANLGATQNRLENTISNLQIQAENLQAAESQISDTDVAQEMTTFVREQILTQAAVAMLSQANSMPKMALQLIEGGS